MYKIKEVDREESIAKKKRGMSKGKREIKKSKNKGLKKVVKVLMRKIH
jgi:hypothetical protein